MLERESDARAGDTGGAAADRVDEEKHRLLRVRDLPVHILRREQLPKSQASQLLAHRLDHERWIRHFDLRDPESLYPSPEPDCERKNNVKFTRRHIVLGA